MISTAIIKGTAVQRIDNTIKYQKSLWEGVNKFSGTSKNRNNAMLTQKKAESS